MEKGTDHPRLWGSCKRGNIHTPEGEGRENREVTMAKNGPNLMTGDTESQIHEAENTNQQAHLGKSYANCKKTKRKS